MTDVLTADDQLGSRLVSTAMALTTAAEQAGWGTLTEARRAELALMLRGLAQELTRTS